MPIAGIAVPMNQRNNNNNNNNKNDKAHYDVESNCRYPHHEVCKLPFFGSLFTPTSHL